MGRGSPLPPGSLVPLAPLPADSWLSVDGSTEMLALLLPNSSSNFISTLLVVSVSTKALLISRVSPGRTSAYWPSQMVSKESSAVKIVASVSSVPFCVALSTMDRR